MCHYSGRLEILMKANFLKIVVLFLVITSFTSCSYIHNTESEDPNILLETSNINHETNKASENNNTTLNGSVTETEEITDTQNSNSIYNEYNALMDIKDYMLYFVNYFHEPYQTGDNVSDKNIISLSFLFALSNKDNLDYVKIDEQSQTMFISGDGLRLAAKNLIYENISLNEYHHYLENTSSVYSENIDTYIVPYARGGWGGDLYYLDEEKELEIIDNDNTITVTATVQYIPQLGTIENTRKLEYTFDKVKYDGFLYYQIKEIRTVK